MLGIKWLDIYISLNSLQRVLHQFPSKTPNLRLAVALQLGQLLTL